MRVLIVEDDEISREILSNALSRAGYDVLVAADGLAALEILREGDCRLVITDWDMPRMNGIELCQAIRRGDFGGYLYVILLTGHDSVQKSVEGLSAGADDFIKKPFDPDELTVRVQAGQRVLALETRDMTIFALAKLAESRDPETGAHLERVRNYCHVLAQYLIEQPNRPAELDREFVRLLYATSPLHDIGKVGIPDYVLLKPGLLSDREFTLMKTHTVLGAKTLEAALGQFPQARFLKMARDIAATHHERWDGSGYPEGLEGEAIPLAGRIVALADVYDALTSKRAYKDSYSHDVSRALILEARGTHFDPQIVAAFVACEEQFLEIRRRYTDESVDDAPAALADAGSLHT